MSDDKNNTLDELLGDRSIKNEEEPSRPQRTEDPSIEHKGYQDRPLPLTVLTQTKNHRELLDYFLTADMPEDGVNKTEIAKESGVSTNGSRRHIDTFLEFGIISETTNSSAHINRYTNDKDSDVHRALRVANNVLAKSYEKTVEE